MKESTQKVEFKKDTESWSIMEQIAREGARKMLQQALENEMQEVENVFTSKILPRYLRRIPSIDNLIPVLYLKGISTNDFPTALSSILGHDVKGLSPANIVRLKKSWEDDYTEWANRDMSKKEYVYFWIDGMLTEEVA